MAYAACLDLRKSLFSIVESEDGSTKRVLNRLLLAQLKALDLRDLYLFADFNHNDFSPPGNLWHDKLLKSLAKEGFRVKAVITPVDVINKHGLGAAYQEYHLANGPNSTEEKVFFSTRELVSVDNKYLSAPVLGRKHAMLKYFAESKPKSLDSIIYLDSSKADLEAFTAAFKDSNLSLASFQLDPETSSTAEQSIFFLELYRTMRLSEQKISKKSHTSLSASAFSFFSQGKGRDIVSKMEAVKKCEQILKGEKEVHFTKEEYQATTNGRLSKLIATNPYLAEQVALLDPKKHRHAERNEASPQDLRDPSRSSG